MSEDEKNVKEIKSIAKYMCVYVCHVICLVCSVSLEPCQYVMVILY